MINTDTIVLIGIIVVVVGILIWLFARSKRIKTSNLTLVTGGLKTGKSLLSVSLAVKDYKARVRAWKWANFWCKVFGKPNKTPKPLLYSNCKIYRSYWDKFRYSKHPENRPMIDGLTLITKDLLARKTRPVEGSVMYFCEASLVADSMAWADKDLNAQISLFFKLFCHETKNGTIYMDTQAMLDLHFGAKRNSSSFLFIAKSTPILFFGRLLWVRECINGEIGVNAFETDLDDSLKMVFIPFWRYQWYDRFEYYYLTESLPYEDKPFAPGNSFVSFNPIYMKLCKNEVKKDESI